MFALMKVVLLKAYVNSLCRLKTERRLKSETQTCDTSKTDIFISSNENLVAYSICYGANASFFKLR